MPDLESDRPEATVLFVDVAGSTALYEKLGDAAALNTIGRCLAFLGTISGQFGGRTIKALGDELMLAFGNPEVALRAATEMQIARQQHSEAGEAIPELRVGFHHGPVLEVDADLFDDTVNIAARVAGLARASQILTTGITANGLPSYARQALRSLHRLPVKGKQEALEVCKVIWRWGEGLTMMEAPESSAEHRAPELILEVARIQTRLSPEQPELVFGRDKGVDIVLSHQKASRRHARIERRRDKFVIADSSTNGTFVRFDDDREWLLHHEELALRGTGVISCGAPTDSEGAETIRFRIE